MNRPFAVPFKLCLAPAPPRAVSGRAQWRAIAVREMRAALLNRFLHLLSAAALAAGLAPLLGERPGESAPYFLVQAILYLVPPFALLIGAGSAQADMEERAFLLTQPVGRLTLALGKWGALWLLFSVASGLLVLPSAVGESALAPLGFLWMSAVETGGVFLAVGMAFGFSSNDRVKAHLAVLSFWLLLLAGFGLLALGMARAGMASGNATLWIAMLMANPLDAFRIGALFFLDRAPLDLAQAPPLARAWLAHPVVWLSVLCAGWTGAALAWCWNRLCRMEA